PRRPGTMLSPRPRRRSTPRARPSDTPRGAPPWIPPRTPGRHPARRAGSTCRRRSSPASPADAPSLRSRAPHGVEKDGDGLPEPEPSVDAIDGVVRATALAQDRLAVTDEELDLRSGAEPQLLAHRDGHRHLPLGRDATLHE